LQGVDFPLEWAFQAYVMQQLNNFPFPKQLSVEDTSSNAYLDGRKPDVSIFMDGIVSSLYVLLIGEVKRKGDFSPSALGELLTFLKRVLYCQPTRSRVIGFLTDGFEVVIMGVNAGTIVRTPRLPLSNGDSVGRLALATLFKASPMSLGYVTRTGVPIGFRLNSFLGSGATSTVFSGSKRNENEQYVIKICTSAEHVDRERKAIEAIGIHPSIPAIIEHKDDSVMTSLVFSPVATEFDLASNRPRQCHFSHLLEVLKFAHDQKYVHCDIRPENWMISSRDNSRPILIDWGFARALDTMCKYRGTVSFASERVLIALNNDASAEFVVGPADDLVSFVLIQFYYITGLRPEYPDQCTPALKAQLSQAFWKKQLDNSFWTVWTKSAQDCDYAALHRLTHSFGSV
jgi:hypothetical protein